MHRVYDDVDPKYAATCSDVTLYSNPRGFFRQLAEDSVTMVAGAWLHEFGARRGDAGKMAAVYENNELMEALNEVLSRVQPMYRGKDAKTSMERRLEAQKSLEAGDPMKALALVSQAVLKAPMTGENEMVDGGVSLALALWLRAEVLLGIGRPAAALEDLKLALRERLPAKMRAHYYWRMGHCYKGCGEATRAKVSYELAARLLVKDAEASRLVAEDIASLDPAPPPAAQTAKVKGVSLTNGAKQNMPAMSKLLKITEDLEAGRFAVADSPVKAGDVLLVESPYASCLLTDFHGSHCVHCFKRLESCTEEAPMWCTKCSGVAFCSVRCKEIACSTYHQYECQFVDLFIGSGMSILSHVALRMVTQSGVDASISIHSRYVSNEIKTVEGSALNDIEGVAKKSRMKNRKERLNRTKKGLKSFDKLIKEESEIEKADEKDNPIENLELKAEQIYSLCTHADQRKPEDYFKRIVMAMFLTECLKKAGFFSKCEKANQERYEKSICELLLRNLQLLQFNAHELYETLRGKHQFSGSKTLYIGVGVYPTGALFNHECSPAVVRYFEGRKIVLRAIRPLRPGEMVSENYGPHFFVRDRRERQRSLACRYWFQCACVACHEDWPKMKEKGTSDSVHIKCPNDNCNGKFKLETATCNSCSTTISKCIISDISSTINDCILKYEEGASAMEREDPEAAISSICSALDEFYARAWPPHRDTHVAQESLRSCFATLGNVYTVPQKENV